MARVEEDVTLIDQDASSILRMVLIEIATGKRDPAVVRDVHASCTSFGLSATCDVEPDKAHFAALYVQHAPPAGACTISTDICVEHDRPKHLSFDDDVARDGER